MAQLIQKKFKLFYCFVWVVGCTIYSFICLYLLELQNDSPNAFANILLHQASVEMKSVLGPFIIFRFNLVNWCIGRSTQASSCCFGGLSCNSWVQAMTRRQLIVRTSLLSHVLVIYFYGAKRFFVVRALVQQIHNLIFITLKISQARKLNDQLFKIIFKYICAT